MAENDQANEPQSSSAPDESAEPTDATEEAVAVAEDVEEEKERPAQTVTVEDIGPARKKLTIEIPAERIGKLVEEQYSKLKDEAVLPGFRRGRAPLRLLEKRFGPSVRDEVQAQLLSEAYTQAVEDEELEVLGEPDIQDKDDIKLPDDGPLTFSVEIEVVPQFELPPLEDIEVKKPTMQTTDDEIDKEIDRDRERHGELIDASDDPIQPGDYVQADVKILPGHEPADDVEPLEHVPQSYILVHGEEMDFKGHAAGILIPDLGKQLRDKKAGEMVTITMTGPGGHENDKIKDQPITVRIRLDKVERIKPADISVLVEGYGMESEQELRDQVRLALEQRKLRVQRAMMHEQVCEFLLQNVEMELPEQLTSRQAQRQLYRRAMDLSYAGVPQEDIEQQIAEMREGNQEQAQKGLKLFFVLEKAARHLDVDVTEQEINGRIALLAMEQGRRPEKLRQEMFRSGQAEQLFVQLRDQKTLDQIIDNARVVEVDAAELEKDEAGDAEEGEAEAKKGGKKKSKKKSSKKEAQETDGGEEE